MSGRVFRLAYLVSHPIQYQAPLLRFLARQPDLELEVLFLSDLSTRPHADRGFGHSVEWDVPLLEGYSYRFLPRWYDTDRLNFAEPLVRGLRAHLVGQGFDALWVHGWFHQANLRAIRAARAAGIPVYLRGESLLHGSGIKRRLKSALQRRVLDGADGFFAIGTRNREFYAHHGVGEERLFDVPYAVDNEFFRRRADEAAPRREALRAELGLEPGRPVILYASKFLERKRPVDLLEAYRALGSGGREPEPYLVYAGSGEEDERLRFEAARTGWDSIRFLGFRNQTELPALFDLCDVFVLPSSYEPWGLVLNEVMNAGRPVIASDCVGAAPDLIEEGLTGFTFPTGDTASLAARLRETLDGERAREMGAAARERIEEWDFRADWAGIRSALATQATRSTAA